MFRFMVGTAIWLALTAIITRFVHWAVMAVLGAVAGIVLFFVLFWILSGVKFPPV